MKRFLTDASVVGMSHAVAALTLISVQVTLARSLSASDFGTILVVQAGVNLAESVFVSRSGEVALHWIGRAWGSSAAYGYAKFLERRELYWNFGVYALLMVLIWPLNTVFAIDPVLLAMLGLSIPAQSGYGVAKSVFISAGRLRLQSGFEIVWCITYLSMTIPLTLLFGLYGFVWASVAAALLKTGAGRWLTRRLWPLSSVSIADLKPPAISLSAHSVLRNLCSSIAAQADVLILGASASKETVAIYKVARTLANMPSRIAGPVWSLLRPRLLKALRLNDDRQFRRLIVFPGLGLIFVGALVSPILWYGSETLVVGLYGDLYQSSANLFLTLFVGAWFFGAVTGWIGFVAVVAKRKLFTTGLFVLLALFVVSAAFLAGDSATYMAIGVASAMGLISLLAWSMLCRPAFLLGKLNTRNLISSEVRLSEAEPRTVNDV